MKRSFGRVLTAFSLAAAFSLVTGIAAGTSANAKATTHRISANTKTNVSKDCKSNGNAVFAYSGTNIKAKHGACVSTIKSNGHSSAAAPSLCRYLVANKGTFNNVSVVSGYPLLASNDLNDILKNLAMNNTTAPTNVGQCVKAYNKAKHSVFKKK